MREWRMIARQCVAALLLAGSVPVLAQAFIASVTPVAPPRAQRARRPWSDSLLTSPARSAIRGQVLSLEGDVPPASPLQDLERDAEAYY